MEENVFFEKLYGNEQLKEYLVSGITEKKLPHALIFEGPEGSGKKTVSLMTAAASEPEYAEKILGLMTPDVTVYAPEDGKKSIGIAQIRDIKYQAYIKPQELDFRLFLIEHAETMTPEAQNALLKILEEPPKDVSFFLLTESASALLPTVRSRAPVLRMQIFDEDVLAEHLAETDKKAAEMRINDPSEYELLIRAAGGSVGEALKLLGNTSGEAEKKRSLTDGLIDALASGQSKNILLFFLRNHPEKEELDALLSGLENAARDMLKCKYGADGTPDAYFTDREKAEEYAQSFARQTLMNIFDTAEELRRGLLVNVNVQSYLLKCAEKLAEAVR